jgi:hypothetical protein
MAIRRRADADAHKTDGEWEELAQFIVYFERKLQGGIEEQRTKVVERTGVHHMETGDESQWPGIAPQSACDWMVRRLPQIENPVPPVGPAPTIETVQTIQPARTAASGRTGTTQHLAGDVAIRSEGRRSVVFIDLHSVQLYQPVRSAVGQALVSGDAVQSSFVVANQPFALETAFSIRDPDALGSGGRPIPCAVEIRASTAGGGADHSIGSATGEADLETGGTVRVVVGGLAAGEYRLAVRVSLQEGYTGSGVLEVPFLRVV